MRCSGDRRVRWFLAIAGSGVLAVAVACHDPDAPPAASSAPQTSSLLVEHMGRGGALRRVIYEPPPDLARPAPAEVELPFPGPAVDDDEAPDPAAGDDDEPGEAAVPDSDAGSA